MAGSGYGAGRDRLYGRPSGRPGRGGDPGERQGGRVGYPLHLVHRGDLEPAVGGGIPQPGSAASSGGSSPASYAGTTSRSARLTEGRPSASSRRACRGWPRPRANTQSLDICSDLDTKSNPDTSVLGGRDRCHLAARGRLEAPAGPQVRASACRPGHPHMSDGQTLTGGHMAAAVSPGSGGVIDLQLQGSAAVVTGRAADRRGRRATDRRRGRSARS
jgi:hypothetical protein